MTYNEQYPAAGMTSMAFGTFRSGLAGMTRWWPPSRPVPGPLGRRRCYVLASTAGRRDCATGHQHRCHSRAWKRARAGGRGTPARRPAVRA